MCLQKDQHTNVCTHTHWMQSGDSAHTHTHTCSWRASLLPHHSTKKGCGDRHGESVWRLVWATGRHAWRGGHGQLHSCSAWIPPVPSQEKRENEGGRGSQRVSRCDLCWHCMSMLKKKEKEGEGDTHLACSCCCPLVACQPLRCRAGVPRTHPSSPHHHHCAASCTRCMCMHVCVSAQCAAHT